MDTKLYYKYWGKARKRDDGAGWDCHLLPYHCLDVAAVGRAWIEIDRPLRERLAASLSIDIDDPSLCNWLGFILTLHDFGKYDIRFQSKAPEVRKLVWPDLNTDDLRLSDAAIQGYDHGLSGYAFFVQRMCDLIFHEDEKYDKLDIWRPWIASVTGHHGIIPNQANWLIPSAERNIIQHDEDARQKWIMEIAKIFLHVDPAQYPVPKLTDPAQPIIAGFCSVVDWIASNDLFVRWFGDEKPLERYFEEAREHCLKTDILHKTGVVGCHASAYSGVATLLPDNNKPRNIQTIIDDLPTEQGMVIIEASTGSGKTEAALAYTWKLLAAGHADSIIFALPTQATADAMLERLQKFAPEIYEGDVANLVLAHGKARYNAVFANLKAAGRTGAAQKGDQGAVQCAEWISSSRKRVFLGQIGVCTIDQVLLSVLPVRHNFVRSFGVMKSVLIVDEVHAYDRYMYGLLEEVLKRQKAAGGSVLLLSATLPAIQKRELFEAWQKGSGESICVDSPYPLISRVSLKGDGSTQSVDKREMPENRVIGVETVISKAMEPDEDVTARLIAAAKGGATVAVVCNLVQSAQRMAKNLRTLAAIASVPVDIFHARYRFKDRQVKEEAVKNLYGKKAPRNTGRILAATQVVEQSLDLDFDWLITQLCPVDLLFQRIGRLHRHERARPKGYENPFCTIIINDSDDFGAHEMVYGDARILWRTKEMLKTCDNTISFPAAYRKWIELVYGREEWEGEPEPDSVIGKSCAFRDMQRQAWYEAQQRATNNMNPFADTDQNAASLTRGKEMGLNVVPVLAGQTKRTLLDGECLPETNEFKRPELLNMNSIPVPVSWRRIGLPTFDDGYIYLPMVRDGDGWIWKNGKYTLKYTTDYGLERLEENE